MNLPVYIIGTLFCFLCFQGTDGGVKGRWRGCKKPKGRAGKSYNKGCYKLTCVEQPRRVYNWVPAFLSSRCCSFNQANIPIGRTVLSATLPDLCTHTAVVCRGRDGRAGLEMEIEDNCPERPGVMNVITNTSAIIATPGFNNSYPANAAECWMRTPSCGHQVQIEFTHFNVLGENDYITMKPPVNGVSKYFGNYHNPAMLPPKIVNFPADTSVEICFNSGAVVHGHLGFRAEMTEKPKTDWITSSNYPEDIDYTNRLDPPEQGYTAGISQCWVQSPLKGKTLELEFFQFDVHSPPESHGDWIAISPNPTKMDKYYGINMEADHSPPKISHFPVDTPVTICFKTRKKVDWHKGFVAELFQPENGFDYSTDSNYEATAKTKKMATTIYTPTTTTTSKTTTTTSLTSTITSTTTTTKSKTFMTSTTTSTTKTTTSTTTITPSSTTSTTSITTTTTSMTTTMTSMTTITTTTTATTTTTDTMTATGDPQCDRSYTTLTDAWRRIEYGVKHPSYNCDQAGNWFSHTGLTAGWYRFHFPSAPYAKIPTTAPLKQYVGIDHQSCGTNAVSWMEDSLPAIGQPPKDVTINFAWYANYRKGFRDYSKGNPSPAKIVACPAGSETMYLYFLSPTPDCFLAYCAL